MCRMAQQSLGREGETALEMERKEGETSEGETQETRSLTCWSGLFLPTFRLSVRLQTAKCAENLRCKCT